MFGSLKQGACFLGPRFLALVTTRVVNFVVLEPPSEVGGEPGTGRGGLDLAGALRSATQAPAELRESKSSWQERSSQTKMEE